MKCKQCGLRSEDVPRPHVLEKELSNYGGVCLDCSYANTDFSEVMVVPDDEWEDESELLHKAALSMGQP